MERRTSQKNLLQTDRGDIMRSIRPGSCRCSFDTRRIAASQLVELQLNTIVVNRMPSFIRTYTYRWLITTKTRWHRHTITFEANLSRVRPNSDCDQPPYHIIAAKTRSAARNIATFLSYLLSFKSSFHYPTLMNLYSRAHTLGAFCDS